MVHGVGTILYTHKNMNSAKTSREYKKFKIRFWRKKSVDVGKGFEKNRDELRSKGIVIRIGKKKFEWKKVKKKEILKEIDRCQKKKFVWRKKKKRDYVLNSNLGTIQKQVAVNIDESLKYDVRIIDVSGEEKLAVRLVSLVQNIVWEVKEVVNNGAVDNLVMIEPILVDISKQEGVEIEDQLEEKLKMEKEKIEEREHEEMKGEEILFLKNLVSLNREIQNNLEGVKEIISTKAVDITEPIVEEEKVKMEIEKIKVDAKNEEMKRDVNLKERKKKELLAEIMFLRENMEKFWKIKGFDSRMEFLKIWNEKYLGVKGVLWMVEDFERHLKRMEGKVHKNISMSDSESESSED